jgi:hypothetical protein
MNCAALSKNELNCIGLCYICIQGLRNEVSTLEVLRQRYNDIEQQNMNGKSALHFFTD